jgi:hypothetical protein
MKLELGGTGSAPKRVCLVVYVRLVHGSRCPLLQDAPRDSTNSSLQTFQSISELFRCLLTMSV